MAPFTLALIRWSTVALALSPIALRERHTIRVLIARHGPFVLLLGLLGVWICGAIVYLALEHTSASNGTLIYTTSSVFIILIDALRDWRAVGLRHAAGSALALCGVAAGTVMLLPVAAWEFLSSQAMPVTVEAWSGIAGIVVFASLLAFLGFQFGIRRLGAPVAGIFMYLMPAYGVGMAVLFLRKEFRPFHALGIVLVMGGVVLATLSGEWFRKLP